MVRGKVFWVKDNADISDDSYWVNEPDYNDIWDNGEDDGIDYSDLSGYEFDADISENVDEETEARWAAIEKLQGTIEYGECMLCGKENGMHFKKGWFFCKTCHDFVPAEVYYQWYSGFDVYLK